MTRKAKSKASNNAAPKFRQKDLKAISSQFKNKTYDGSGLNEIAKLAEISSETLINFYKKIDSEIYQELLEMNETISNLRSEISVLNAKEIGENRLPSAGHELDQVLKSTNDASNSIMESAENIMALDTSDHEKYVEEVNSEIMKIFEACSFQDLTGQRIAKVIEVIEMIEKRLNNFSDKFKINACADTCELTKEEQEREERRKRLILHGPQDEGVALEQNNIDSLFDDIDVDDLDSADDAIDKLFD